MEKKMNNFKNFKNKKVVSQPKFNQIMKQKNYKSSKSNDKNNNYPQRKSPKTIDYDIFMEKYGNMIDNSCNKCNNKNNIHKFNKISKTPLNKSPDDNLNKTDIFEDSKNIDEEDKNTFRNSKKIFNQKNLIQKLQNPKPKNKINIIRNNGKKNMFCGYTMKTKGNINCNLGDRYNLNEKNKNKNLMTNLALEKLKKEINNFLYF